MKFDPPLFHPNGKPKNDTSLPCIPLTHDLVYPDGNVCISILHTPGDDPTMYESASERWSPVQSVEKVILSVISMLAGELFRPFACHMLPLVMPFSHTDHFAPTLILFLCFLFDILPIPSCRSDFSHAAEPHAEPNLESGANIDCCKLYRENKAEYERIVRQSVKEQLGL